MSPHVYANHYSHKNIQFMTTCGNLNIPCALTIIEEFF